MTRISLLHRMDVLLESCKGCTRLDATPEIKCKGCNTYAQLKEIGTQLEGGIKVRKALTVEQYNDLRNKGLNDKEIAHKFEMSKATLYNRKLSWGIIKKQAITLAEKDVETQSTHTDKNAEYRQLINELSNALEKAKVSEQEISELNEKLELKIKKLEDSLVEKNHENDELKGLHAACDDVESELTSLKDERDNYRNQLLDTRHELMQKDYVLENQKKALEHVRTVMERYELENKAMRGLLVLWI